MRWVKRKCWQHILWIYLAQMYYHLERSQQVTNHNLQLNYQKHFHCFQKVFQWGYHHLRIKKQPLHTYFCLKYDLIEKKIKFESTCHISKQRECWCANDFSSIEHSNRSSKIDLCCVLESIWIVPSITIESKSENTVCEMKNERNDLWNLKKKKLVLTNSRSSNIDTIRFCGNCWSKPAMKRLSSYCERNIKETWRERIQRKIWVLEKQSLEKGPVPRKQLSIYVHMTLTRIS